MANQSIGIGSAVDDGTGDTLRVAIDKVNDNFLEIYTLIGDASSLTSGISATATVVTLTAPLVATSISPSSTDGATLGTTSLEWSDLYLADSSIIYFGADQDTTLTHVADTGLLINSTRQLQFGDSGTYIHQSADGVLDLVSDTEIEINATLIDVNGNLDVSGTGVIAGAVTTAALTASGIIKTDDATQATSTTDGSLQTDGGLSVVKDAVIGGAVDITGAVTTAALTASGIIKTDDSTAATSTTDGSLQTDGGLSVVKDAVIGGDIKVKNLGVITAAGTDFEAIELENEVGDLLREDGGRVMSETSSSLSLGGGGLVGFDLDGPLTIGGNLVIPNGGFVGSAGDANSIVISSSGVVTMNQIPVFSAGLNVSGGTIAGTLSTAAQTNITSLGTLTALTVDDVAVNGKVITMTGDTSDTVVFTAGAAGTLSIVTTDAAGAAGNIQITADGTVDIDSAGVLTLDSGAAINIEPASGSAILLDGTISIDAGVVTGATSITSTAFVGDITGDVTGNADTATTLATARTIGGTSFNGSANIAVGLAATATALATARTIGGTSFDGTANIAVALASVGTAVTVADESSDTTCFPLFATAATGDLPPKSGSNLTFNASSGLLTATLFAGALTGNVTGNASGTAATVTGAAQSAITSVGTLTTLQVDNININGNAITSTAGTDLTISPVGGQQIVLDGAIVIDAGVVTGATSITSTAFVGGLTGNASTATALATARTIGGTSFDGSGNIAVALASVGTAVTVADESSDTTCFPLFTTAATGDLPPKSGTNLTFNSSTGIVTATGFAGALTGNVTGNASGTALTVTQAAQTNITSVGTLTALQIDNLNLNGNTLSSTAGTDLLITPLAGQQIVLDATIIIDAGVVTGATSITSTAFVGDITGDVTGTADEATALTGVTSTAAELNILDASAGNTAVASDVTSSAGAITSNNAKIKHTLTLAGELADDAVHADVVVTSDKCLATSTVIANANLDVQVRIHTVVAGSFKVSITNLSGGALANDSTIILNYTII